MHALYCSSFAEHQRWATNMYGGSSSLMSLHSTLLVDCNG